MRGGWPGMRIITSQGMTNAWSRHDMCLCGQVCLSMTGDPWVWRRGAERRADRDPQSRQAGPPMPWGTFIFYLRWYFFYLSSLIVIMVSVSSMGCKDFPPPSSSLVLLLFALESAFRKQTQPCCLFSSMIFFRLHQKNLLLLVIYLPSLPKERLIPIDWI